MARRVLRVKREQTEPTARPDRWDRRDPLARMARRVLRVKREQTEPTARPGRRDRLGLPGPAPGSTASMKSPRRVKWGLASQLLCTPPSTSKTMAPVSSPSRSRAPGSLARPRAPPDMASRAMPSLQVKGMRVESAGSPTRRQESVSKGLRALPSDGPRVSTASPPPRMASGSTVSTPTRIPPTPPYTGARRATQGSVSAAMPPLAQVQRRAWWAGATALMASASSARAQASVSSLKEMRLRWP